MLVFLSHDPFFKLKLGAHQGTNTHVVLLALWGLMIFFDDKVLRNNNVINLMRKLQSSHFL